jgi:hypothetical protein
MRAALSLTQGSNNMPEAPTKTARGHRAPLVRQFSVFLPNKVGALLDLTRTLGDTGVHICGLSVIDTADSAVVRMVVDDPDRARAALQGKQMAASESSVVVVELPQGPEKLGVILSHLLAAEVNIQYTYSLMIRPHDKALLALHCEEPEFARDALTQAGYTVLTQNDISR